MAQYLELTLAKAQKKQYGTILCAPKAAVAYFWENGLWKNPYCRCLVTRPARPGFI